MVANLQSSVGPLPFFHIQTQYRLETHPGGAVYVQLPGSTHWPILVSHSIDPDMITTVSRFQYRQPPEFKARVYNGFIEQEISWLLEIAWQQGYMNLSAASGSPLVRDIKCDSCRVCLYKRIIIEEIPQRHLLYAFQVIEPVLMKCFEWITCKHWHSVSMPS